MTSWPSQLGDVGNRLARAFGIVGRTPTSVSDPIQLRATLADLSLPPYADEPGFFGGQAAATGAVGKTGAVILLGRATRTLVLGVTFRCGTAGSGFSALLFRNAGGIAPLIPGASLNKFGTALVNSQNSITTTTDVTGVTGVGNTIETGIVSAANQNQEMQFANRRPAMMVLGPGDALVISTGASSAVTITVDFQWSEYAR